MSVFLADLLMDVDWLIWVDDDDLPIIKDDDDDDLFED